MNTFTGAVTLSKWFCLPLERGQVVNGGICSWKSEKKFSPFRVDSHSKGAWSAGCGNFTFISARKLNVF